MSHDITVTFEDGSQHVYKGAPDGVTPEQVTKMAQEQFGKTVTALDGGAQAQTQAAPAQPRTAAPSTPRPSRVDRPLPRSRQDDYQQSFKRTENAIYTQEVKPNQEAIQFTDALVMQQVPYSVANKALKDKFDMEIGYSPEEWQKFVNFRQTERGEQLYKGQQMSFDLTPQKTGLTDPKAPEDMVEEFSTSVNRSFEDLKNTGVAGKALVQNLFGNEEEALATLDEYVENQIQIDFANPTNVGNVTDINSLGDAGMWAANTLGMLAPDIATSMGIGTLSRAAAKKIMSKTVNNMVEDMVENGATREAAEAAVARLASKRADRVMTAAVTGQSIGDSSARVFGDTYGSTGEQSPGASIAAGVLGGTLESILPANVLKKFTGVAPVENALDTMVARYGKEFVKGWLTEGGTEALQEVIENIPEYMITGELAVDGQTLFESFMRGGFGGGVVSTGSQTIVERKNRDVKPDVVETFDVPTAGDRRTKEYTKQINTFMQQLNNKVADIAGDWEQAPNIEIHRNFTKLPGVSNRGVGIYREDGTVQINAEGVIELAKRRKISTEQAVEAVVFHEALGHHSLDLKFGKELDDTLLEMYNNGGKRFRDTVEQWMKKNPDAYAAQGEEKRLARSIEEVIAEMSETSGKIPSRVYDRIADLLKNFARQMGWNAKYSTREVRSILGIAQRDLVEGRADRVFEPSDGGDKFIYIGESNLIPRKQDALDRAEEAYNSLYTMLPREWDADLGAFFTRDSDIEELNSEFGPEGGNTGSYVTYGAFRGPDGEWRTEISDRPAKLIVDPRAIPSGKDMGRYTLENVLNHPELFEAYPQLADVAVTSFDGDPRERAFYQPGPDPEIGLNTNRTNEEILSSLLHEVQHWIQDFEGWAMGGNPQIAFQTIPDDVLLRGSQQLLKGFKREVKESERWLIDQERYDMVKDLPLTKKYQEDWKKYRDSGFKNDDLREQLENTKEELRVFIGVPDRIRDRPYWWYILLNNIETGGVNSFMVGFHQKRVDKYEELKSAITDLDYGKMRDIAKKDPQASQEAYEAIFGEVEARDTQARQMMGEVDRLFSAPYSSQNYGPEDYIFSGKNGLPMRDQDGFERPSEATSAGFRRRIPRDRDLPEIRKNFWRKKRLEAERLEALERGEIQPGEEYFPSDDDGKYMTLPEDAEVVEQTDEMTIVAYRGDSYQADGRTVPVLAAISADGSEPLAVVRPRPFESKDKRIERLKENARIALNPPSEVPPSAKYMRLEKGAEPLDPSELTPEELYETENAYEIISRTVDNYTGVSTSFEEMQEQLLKRSIPPSAALRLVGTKPGEIAKKIFMYDIAAQKMNDRLTVLEEKIRSGDYTEDDKLAYLQTRLGFDDLMSKIFGLQSEVGRALRAVRDVRYTRNNFKTLKEALKEFKGTSIEGVVADPTTFENFMMLDRKKRQAATKTDANGETVYELMGTFRTLMSSYDLSAPLRQGIMYIDRKEYWGAVVQMHLLAGPDGNLYYRDMMKDIQENPNYGFTQIGELQLANLEGQGNLDSQEEKFQGARFAKLVPFVGEGVEISERAYIGFLNKLRFDMFDFHINQLIEGGLLTNPSQLLNEEGDVDFGLLSDEEVKIVKALGDVVSTFTGRSQLPNTIFGLMPIPNDMLRKANNFFNAIHFSTRLAWSRIKTVNPLYYATLPAPVREIAAKQMGWFSGVVGSVLGSLSVFGELWFDDEDEDRLEVDWDPRSSNFLRIKYNGTYYDVTGGMASYLVLNTRTVIEVVNRAFDNKYPSEINALGEPVIYNDGRYEKSYSDYVGKFYRYKLSPNASFLADMYYNETAIGEDFTIAKGVVDRTVPLFMQQVAESAKADQSALQVITTLGLGFYGVGSNTYTPYQYDPEREMRKVTKFQDKDFPNMETDDIIAIDGQVYLKPHIQEAWSNVSNNMFALRVNKIMEMTDWDSLTKKQKSDALDLAAQYASDEAAKYMKNQIKGQVLNDAKNEKLREEVMENE